MLPSTTMPDGRRAIIACNYDQNVCATIARGPQNSVLIGSTENEYVTTLTTEEFEELLNAGLESTMVRPGHSTVVITSSLSNEYALLSHEEFAGLCKNGRSALQQYDDTTGAHSNQPVVIETAQPAVA